ncbi:conserved hypothetical protein [Xanthomonas oryzae pv. oryzae MAFF 311018]|nr:conserved hypothetical protein [Xanthomonas oryzae pv. oryzae MAFF 311018]
MQSATHESGQRLHWRCRHARCRQRRTTASSGTHGISPQGWSCAPAIGAGAVKARAAAASMACMVPAVSAPNQGFPGVFGSPWTSHRYTFVSSARGRSARRLISQGACAVRHSHDAVNEKASDMPGPFFHLSHNSVRDIIACIACIACSTAASAAIRTASADRRWH